MYDFVCPKCEIEFKAEPTSDGNGKYFVECPECGALKYLRLTTRSIEDMDTFDDIEDDYDSFDE